MLISGFYYCYLFPQFGFQRRTLSRMNDEPSDEPTEEPSNHPSTGPSASASSNPRSFSTSTPSTTNPSESPPIKLFNSPSTIVINQVIHHHYVSTGWNILIYFLLMAFRVVIRINLAILVWPRQPASSAGTVAMVLWFTKIKIQNKRLHQHSYLKELSL